MNARIEQLRVLLYSTQGSLLSIAEDAHQAGEEDLYASLHEFYTGFEQKCEKLLAQYGAGTPEKPKTKLQVVK